MMPHTSLRIIDPCAPRPYSSLTDMRGLGGTESTVIRVATALAGCTDIVIEQAARQSSESSGRIMFRPMQLQRHTGGTIIVINSWKVALICRRHNPSARVLVWQHVVPGRHFRSMVSKLASAKIEIVCVSQSLAILLGQFAAETKLSIRVVVNPIADDLRPDKTMRDPDMLFFASSSHKGLDQVFASFATLRAQIPSLRLELADPGYLVWDSGAVPQGVVLLGTLSHADVIARMRRALCIFYPQSRFAETFGLVIAEANAVGCPALVHRGLGANDEVASDSSQCIDCHSSLAIEERIKQWRGTPPSVALPLRFRQTAVTLSWQRLLKQSPEVPVQLMKVLSYVR